MELHYVNNALAKHGLLFTAVKRSVRSSSLCTNSREIALWIPPETACFMAITQGRDIILSDNLHPIFTQLRLPAGSTALAAIPICCGCGPWVLFKGTEGFTQSIQRRCWKCFPAARRHLSHLTHMLHTALGSFVGFYRLGDPKVST